jgi:hypothetical protein
MPGCPHCAYVRHFGRRSGRLTDAQLQELLELDARRIIAMRLIVDAPNAGRALLALATADRQAAAERIFAEWEAAA